MTGSVALPQYNTDLDPAYYQPKPEALDFLHKTISSDDEEVKTRVFQAQKEAYDIHPFPCILRFQFIALRMYEHKLYSEIIKLGQENPGSILLDLGCCMGTDIRKAVLDGFPADYAVGADLFPAFIEAGYKLWQDKDTCRIKFVQGDIFKLPPTPIAPSTVPLTSVAALEQLGGKVNYLYTGSVFHLFDEPEQAEMALRVAIISARQPGSIIFGRHRGAEVKGFSQSMRTDKESFGHSPATWKELWTETLTKIESAEFVQDHVVLAAELLEVEVVSNYKRRVLQWSVRFV